MDHKGIRYAIRAATGRNQWIVAIYPDGIESGKRRIYGDRQDADLMARSLIDKWLRRHRLLGFDKAPKKSN
jgi:hypothetical protein